MTDHERARTLLALADRVEAATGSDRELDARIWFAVEALPMPVGREWSDYREAVDYMWGRGGFPPSRYTASLDAAMSLVPEGWDWAIGTGRKQHMMENGRRPWAWCAPSENCALVANILMAATPALALTCAALRARAAMLTGEGA